MSLTAAGHVARGSGSG